MSNNNEELKVLFKELLDKEGVWDEFWELTKYSSFIRTNYRTEIEFNNYITSRSRLRSIIQNAFEWGYHIKIDWSLINNKWFNIFDEWDRERRKNGNNLIATVDTSIDNGSITYTDVSGTATWIYDG